MTREAIDALESRRKRVRFRSWHRGMREVDLLLGAFADACVDDLTEAEIEQYEALLELPDADLLDWIAGRRPLDEAHRTAISDKVEHFCRNRTF